MVESSCGKQRSQQTKHLFTRETVVRNNVIEEELGAKNGIGLAPNLALTQSTLTMTNEIVLQNTRDVNFEQCNLGECVHTTLG